jgi:hypothetical protein
MLASHLSCRCSPTTHEIRRAGKKAATKEKFTRFDELLEEVGERHWIAKGLEEDSEERGAVG